MSCSTRDTAGPHRRLVGRRACPDLAEEKATTHTADGPAAAPPPPAALAALLDVHAPFGPAPLCPEVQVFQGRSLVALWEAAEALAGREQAAPFWAYAWPAGCALARVLLDRPGLARGRRVLDIGCGGGVSALAAARAGAAKIVANDIDGWALATVTLAAARQGLSVQTLLADLTTCPDDATRFDLVLCGDLHYERGHAASQRALLQRARAHGARVLVADAERAYFAPDGLRLLAEYRVPVPQDLEGVDERVARVYEME